MEQNWNAEDLIKNHANMVADVFLDKNLAHHLEYCNVIIRDVNASIDRMLVEHQNDPDLHSSNAPAKFTGLYGLYELGFNTYSLRDTILEKLRV